MTPLTSADVMNRARALALRGAVVSSLAALFPQIAVKAHIGKIDMSDVLAKDVFVAPSIVVAVTRGLRDDRLSGADDMAVELVAYVIAENKMVDGRLVTADEFALAHFEQLIIALSDDAFASWGLENIGLPEDVKGGPLFTVKSVTQGTVFYGVSWRQELLALAPPDFDTMGGD